MSAEIIIHPTLSAAICRQIEHAIANKLDADYGYRRPWLQEPLSMWDIKFFANPEIDRPSDSGWHEPGAA